jgi:hypothetical protein
MVCLFFIYSIFTHCAVVEGQFVIADKTISRQHLIVEVGEAWPSDCVRTSIYVYRTLANIPRSLMLSLDLNSR